MKRILLTLMIACTELCFVSCNDIFENNLGGGNNKLIGQWESVKEELYEGGKLTNTSVVLGEIFTFTESSFRWHSADEELSDLVVSYIFDEKESTIYFAAKSFYVVKLSGKELVLTEEITNYKTKKGRYYLMYLTKK